MKEFLQLIVEKSGSMTPACLRAEMFNILTTCNPFTAHLWGNSLIIWSVVSEKSKFLIIGNLKAEFGNNLGCYNGNLKIL